MYTFMIVTVHLLVIIKITKDACTMITMMMVVVVVIIIIIII